MGNGRACSSSGCRDNVRHRRSLPHGTFLLSGKKSLLSLGLLQSLYKSKLTEWTVPLWRSRRRKSIRWSTLYLLILGVPTMPEAVFLYIPVYPFVAGTLAVLQLSDNSQVLLFGKTAWQHIVQYFSSVISVGCQCRGGRLLQLTEHICGMIQHSLSNSKRRVVILIRTFQSQRLSFRH